MPLGTEVDLGQGDFMLDGDPAPTKGAQPQFSAHVRCGQTPGWIKMPHGMEVGLGPGEFVSGGDPAPPIFGPCLLWPNGRPSQIVLCCS